MENLLQDLRYGIRMLLNKPGFTVIAVIALALGIGANTAIFSVVNEVLYRPLPYDDPDRLVWAWQYNNASNVTREPLSFPNYVDYRSQGESFEDMGAFTGFLPILTAGGEPERLRGGQVSASLFPVLRVGAALGRTFSPEEDQPGKNRVVILSDGLWKRRFGSDMEIVGKPVTLNNVPFTVVGVMPASLNYPSPDDPRPIELWVPLGLDANQMHRRLDFLSVVGRLKPGVSLKQAQAEMDTVSARLEQQYPENDAGWGLNIIPLHERFVGDVKPAMLVLFGAVAFLLLIACANVANLLLVRATVRQKEIAIRKALGAARGRLVRQFLTESVVLAAAGGVAGSLLAFWGLKALVAYSPGNIPRIASAAVDSRVLVFTLLVTVATGILFGLAPAMQASNPDLNETLKEGGRGTTDSSGRRLRNILVVVEVALALVLLIGAGLMIKSFLRLQHVDPGFKPDHVLTMEFSLPRSKYKENHQILAFYTQLTEKLQSIPGVESASAVSWIPLSGNIAVQQFEIEGRPEPPSGHVNGAQAQVVSPEYFRTMGISLLSGRLFTGQDSQDAPGALVINDVMAERHWPGEDPIGKRITLADSKTGPWLTIIGVVREVRQHKLDAESYPQMYENFAQNPSRGTAMLVRTAGDPASMTGAIRSQLAEIDRDQPLYNVRTMEQIISESIGRQRFNMLLITIFTAVAIVLAAVGIYGVISYSVSQRSHEIGIRLALGARPNDIFKMVLTQGLRVVLVGVSIGLVAAYALTRIMVGLLYSVSATDPATFAGVSLVLVLVALAACHIPARRATKVDPMVALRYE